MKLDGFYKDTKHGRVFQTRATNLWKWGKVEVGCTVELEHHESGDDLGSITVAAIGNPFTIGKHAQEWVYLYLTAPQPQATVPFVAPREESPDEPIDRLEWERQREQGRTGELPGA